MLCAINFFGSEIDLFRSFMPVRMFGARARSFERVYVFSGSSARVYARGDSKIYIRYIRFRKIYKCATFMIISRDMSAVRADARHIFSRLIVHYGARFLQRDSHRPGH